MSKKGTNRPALLRHLGDPDLVALISAEKLSRSAQLIAAVRWASVSAMAHGDTTDMRRLLDIFHGTAYQSRLIRWFEDRCGMLITRTDKGLEFARRKGAIPRELIEREYFPEAAKAVADQAAAKRIEALMRKGVAPNSDSSCIMDKGRRQPGSFEGGRRR